MNIQDKTKEELIKELLELNQAHNALKLSHEEVTNKRKQAEEALSESEGKYRLLEQNSSDVIWKLDNNYHFTYVSPSIYQLRGLTSEEAMRESFQDTMPFHSQEVIYKAIIAGKEKEKLKDYEHVRLEIEQYHKDKHLVWVELSIRAMLDDQGEKIGYLGISRDITQRKISEKKIKEAVERFDTLLTNVPIGLYVFWIRANGHMEFEYVSDRWCEIVQISREEALADAFLVNMHIHEDEIEDFLLLNREAAREQKKFVWEGRFTNREENQWFRIESIPVVFDNGDIQWYGIHQEITDRKLAEKALLESEMKLRDLNAQKDKFFSIIAHDLKSPFNAIIGFSDLLMDQINEKDYEGIYEYAKIIGQSSHRAMDLLMNLLEWSHSQTGRMLFNPISFDLVGLIKENIGLFENIASQKAISIKKVLPQESPVFADKPMISTVLRNLTSNAIKFTKEGGEINILVEKNSKEIIFSVSDNGIGIEPKRLEKLFRIGESDSTPGTNNEKGTGLGLILCKEFVENHGGKIWAESEEGKGSTFYFTLFNNSN